jgi:hypothetical protein
MPVRQVIDQAAIQELLRNPAGGVARDMLRRGRNVERAAKRFVKVDTGRLRASINTNQRIFRGRPGARVGSGVKYALMVHEGTGIYGPRGIRIRPRRRTFLRFQSRVTGGIVFARSVKGQRGVPYLKLALVFARD